MPILVDHLDNKRLLPIPADQRPRTRHGRAGCSDMYLQNEFL
jgi:hypothetical protein